MITIISEEPLLTNDFFTVTSLSLLCTPCVKSVSGSNCSLVKLKALLTVTVTLPSHWVVYELIVFHCDTATLMSGSNAVLNVLIAPKY